MIKTHKERPKYSIIVTDAIICDLCKKEFKGGNWTDDIYKEMETHVSYKDAAVYPEGDYFTNEEIVVDLCPDCFKNRLIPWLKSQGADVRVTGDLL